MPENEAGRKGRKKIWDQEAGSRKRTPENETGKRGGRQRAPGGQSFGQQLYGRRPLHVGSSGHHFKHADRGPLRLLRKEQRQAESAAWAAERGSGEERTS